MKEKKIAYLAGGCFWCTEAVFQRLKGVENILPGYMGGQIKNPAYREICTGRTNYLQRFIASLFYYPRSNYP